MLNLDTHILIKARAGDLSRTEEKVLRRNPAWCISGIVLWEISKLHQLQRIRFGLDYPPLRKALDSMEIIPVDYKVCRSIELLDFQSDPADEIIAATSLAYQLPLLTRDTRILSSRLVQFP